MAVWRRLPSLEIMPHGRAGPGLDMIRLAEVVDFTNAAPSQLNRGHIRTARIHKVNEPVT